MKSFLTCCLLVIPTALFAFPFSHYQLIETSYQFKKPGILTTTWRWQDGTNELNQFRIKRVRNFRSFRRHQPFLFVSPFNVTLEKYSLTTTGQYRHSIEAQLALAGFDVWIVEDRVYTAPETDCQQRYDCSVMADWGFNLRTKDIEFTRSQMALTTGVTNPVIGGITGGGVAALAAVNAHPEKYRAVFSTGGFYSEEPTIQTFNQQSCDLFRKAIANGDYYRDSLSGFDTLINLAKNDPDAPSPSNPSLSNYQFVVDLLTSAGALGFLAYTPDYRFAAPNETKTDYKYMNAALFFEDTTNFGTLVSHNHFTDFYCSIAGERTYMSQLDQFTGNVLLMGGGQAMAPLQVDSKALFPQARVRIIIDPSNGGEADNYLVDFDWRQEVLDQPLLQWLASQYR